MLPSLSVYLKELKATRSYYILLPFIILAGYSIYHLASPEVAIFIGKEDHLVEWLTFVCLAISAVYFFLSFRKFKNFYFLLLSIVMFFGSGEEISWGQRVFGFQAPESIKESNVQGEFTIHNLEVFNGKQFDKKKRSGIERLLEMDMLFKIFMLSFCILLPLAVWHLGPISKLVQNMRIPVPPVTIGIFFIIAWFGRIVVLHFLKQPPPGTDMAQYFAMLNAASEYYEFMASTVLASTSIFFYKNKYGSLIGKDIKSYLVSA